MIEYSELMWCPIYVDGEPTETVIDAWVSCEVWGVDDKGFDIRQVKVRPTYCPTAWALEYWCGSTEGTVPFLEKIFESLVTSGREGYFDSASA